MTSRIRRLDLLENACHHFVDVDDNSNQTQSGGCQFHREDSHREEDVAEVPPEGRHIS